ncbi:MAG: YggT family protein [Rhizomicrobium sp.]|nr:YggT family protein [Rhizomicrobium sp.]
MYITPMGPAAVLVTVLSTILQFYIYVVFAAVIMSWLLNFNVVNYHNNVVRTVVRTLDALTEPVFRFVRRYLPPMGGLDLSPLVIILVIWILQGVVVPWLGILVFRLVG